MGSELSQGWPWGLHLAPILPLSGLGALGTLHRPLRDSCSLLVSMVNGERQFSLQTFCED